MHDVGLGGKEVHHCGPIREGFVWRVVLVSGKALRVRRKKGGEEAPSSEAGLWGPV